MYLRFLFLPFFFFFFWEGSGGRTRGKEARRRADITKPLGGFQPPSDTMLWGSWATVWLSGVSGVSSVLWFCGSMFCVSCFVCNDLLSQAT